MDNKRTLPVILSGIIGGIFFIFLNIFFNPQFTAGKDVMHHLGAIVFRTQFFENHTKTGIFLAIFLVLLLSIGYAFMIMVIVKKRNISTAILRSIIPGIGLYCLRLIFYLHGTNLRAYLAGTWIILLLFIAYSISVAWQYKWFRKNLAKLVN